MRTTTVWRCCSNLLNTCRLGLFGDLSHINYQHYASQVCNSLDLTAYTSGGTKWMLQTYTCLPSSSQHSIQPRWDQVDAADLHLPTLIIPAQHTTQVGPCGHCRPTPAYPHHPSSPCRSRAPGPESPPCTPAPSSFGP